MITLFVAAALNSCHNLNLAASDGKMNGPF